MSHLQFPIKISSNKININPKRMEGKKIMQLTVWGYLLIVAMLFAGGPGRAAGRIITTDPFPCTPNYCDYVCYKTGSQKDCGSGHKVCGHCIKVAGQVKPVCECFN
ncbi:hypothetical protein ABFS82_06G192200 [Erythranthe guttata]